MSGLQMGEKHEKVLTFLREKSSGGLPPTVREICTATKIKSTSSVHAILRSLVEQGYITRDARASRAIKIQGMQSYVQVPLIGVVTAGIPILAVENIEQYMPCPADIAKNKELFALRVKGLSMKNAAILDGDIVFAEHTSTAQQGDIVIALIEDEATVKRYYFENGKVRLQPENPDFEPIVSDNIQILGRVVASFRQY